MRPQPQHEPHAENHLLAFAALDPVHDRHTRSIASAVPVRTGGNRAWRELIVRAMMPLRFSSLAYGGHHRAVRTRGADRGSDLDSPRPPSAPPAGRRPLA